MPDIDELIKNRVSPKQPTFISQNQPKPGLNVNDYMLGLFNSPPEPPEYDMKRQKALKEGARMNSAAQVLSLLADTVGAGFGGNVNRSNFQSNYHFLDAIMKEKDRYKAMRDNYKQNLYEHRLRMLSPLMQMDAQKRDDEYRDKALKEQSALRRAQMAYEAYQDQQKADQWEKEYGLKEKQAEETARYHNGMIKARGDAANSKANKPFMSVNLRGVDVPVSEGQYRQYLEEAFRSMGAGEEDLKTMMASFQHQPTEEYKQIVAKYLLKKYNEGLLPGESQKLSDAASKMTRSFSDPRNAVRIAVPNTLTPKEKQAVIDLSGLTATGNNTDPLGLGIN